MVERRLAKANVAGPNPVSRSTDNNATTRCYYFAPLAQLVEQLTLNQRAQGSSPWRCTKTKKSKQLLFFVLCATKGTRTGGKGNDTVRHFPARA